MFASVVGLVVRISAFQADGPGSIPGRRIITNYKFQIRVRVGVGVGVGQEARESFFVY